ncbi:carbohydrate ABC transporter permease [Streptosporangium amethystogenes]|uniref:carbohydrate ABC transporter permease n=1 Tax=Streptosporangium amethystogenes TaxID=2002 RepID=UPI0004C8F034|nr:sugar ABC transporter permease [Streptosporangium amethystogenes]
MSTVHAAPPRWRRGEGLKALLWMSPWLVGFAVFFAYPLAATVYFSFYRYDLFTLEFIGLDNYRYFLVDDRAWASIKNTLWLVVLMVPAQVLFGLGVAWLLTRLKSGVGFFRTVFYLPSLIPVVAGTVSFVFLLNPSGPLNQFIELFGIAAPDWFGDKDWSKPSLTMLAMWGIGNTMMIFLAALLDVPKHLYEAAAIDGAGAWRQFRSITLPTISPVLMFSTVTGVIYALQYFTQAMIASRVAAGVTDSPGSSFVPGYPELSTLTLAQWLFHVGFRDFSMGYACVLALLLFAFSTVFTLILLRRFRAFDEGGDR